MKLTEEKKQQVSAVLDDEESFNTFYDAVSIVFRLASFVLIASFLIYIIFSAFSNADDFSYENFEYIIRNFALTLDEKKDDSLYSIEYNPDTCRSYSLFGKGLAVCGNSGLSIYSATGRQTCAESFSYKNPIMTSSDKYVLVYDHGNNAYTLYNSFTDVFSAELPKPIKGASISNNGCYALITSSDEYNSTVEVYNENFVMVNRFNKHGYVIDTDINDEYVLIVSVDANSSHDFSTELILCEIGSTEAAVTVNVESDFPVSCHIIPQGFMVICSNSVAFFDQSGQTLGEYEYSESELTDFAVSDDHAALLFKERGFDIEYQLVCIDLSGNVCYERSFNTTVFDVELSESMTFVLFDDKIVCVDTNYETSVEFYGAEHGCELLAYGRGSLYVCTNTAAPLVRINE